MNISEGVLVKKKRILISIALLLLALFVGFILFRNNKEGKVATVPSVTVQVTASGFQPSTLSVRAGTQVVFQNVDVNPRRVAENPYPKDESTPGLDSGVIVPNGSYLFTATEAKTIQFHDASEPTNNGQITVLGDQ